MHIQDPVQKQWLQDRMEATMNLWPLDDGGPAQDLNRLIQAEEFEHFLQSRFVGQKRFGLEGLETAIAVLDEILDRAANENAHEAVIGMAHRGRLNVLANVVGKSMAQVFSEFEGEPDPESVQGSGDVKYHLGASGCPQVDARAKRFWFPSPSIPAISKQWIRLLRAWFAPSRTASAIPSASGCSRC